MHKYTEEHDFPLWMYLVNMILVLYIIILRFFFSMTA